MTTNGALNGAQETELALLHRRVIELEAQLAAQQESRRLPITQAALDSLPMPAVLYQPDGLMVAANAQLAQMLGVALETMVGQYNLFQDPIAQDSGSADALAAALRGETMELPALPFDLKDYAEHTNNTSRKGWLDITFIGLRNDQGEIDYALCMFLDVTARIEQERHLNTFKALADYAPDGVTFSDLEGKLLYTNRAFQEMTGHGEDVLSLTIFDLYTEDAAYLGAAAQETVEKGFWQGMLTYRRPDGSTFPGEVSVFLLRDTHGQPFGFGAFARDITEQQAQEQALRASEARLRTMLDRLPILINIIDRNGVVSYHDGKGQEALGLRANQLVGRSITDIYPNNPEILAGVERTLAGETFAFQNELQGVLYDNWGTPLLDAVGQISGAIFVSLDVTAQKRAEVERQTLQEQVIEAQQAALRELSTPLIPIAEGVVAMPLIGSVDSNRAQLVIETLLDGVAEMRANTTIIDITGVPVVDTQVASALLRAAQALKLLGAKVILTGIRPEVAQTLVGLGVDLSGISTRATLQNGIAEALGRA